jgi:hypothetical protein
MFENFLETIRGFTNSDGNNGTEPETLENSEVFLKNAIFHHLKTIKTCYLMFCYIC